MEHRDDLQRFRPFLRALADELLYADLQKKVDPSDLVQQTMLQAIEAQSQYRGNSDAAKAGWLKAILRNLVNGLLRSYRSECRDISREQEFRSPSQSDPRRNGPGLDISGDQTSPSHQAQLDEEKERISKVMKLLTNDQRRAIAMRYWEDLGLDEIGKAMGKTPDAVAGLLYRGMKILRSELGA
ncbi:MAG: sigma-70 family RNA polymerase sigma factor [Pirellula sp.]